MIKRLLDILIAAVGLVGSAPVQAAIAVAVKADTPGPVLFRQVRVGRYGRPFEILKFRTMAAGSSGAAITPSGDRRVTRVGAVLRRTKLDELPQLWNVLVGQMSLVGPRPEVPQYVELWPARRREIILSVRPGITDPASIEFRDEGALLAAQPDPERYYREVLLPRKTQLYAEYVASATTRGDLAIIGRTLAALRR
ncbi:MAG: sugar transferase [Austwickia sp.]|nr:sugar transferase [Austwickia sp.]MBK8436838.1 sugar transferase [Austwickia sp.]MBK9100466.1 sugar transferase [Austwickia sp.]